MYPGSLPLILNGSVPGHEKLINVRRCSMYTGVQFNRFHCIYIYIYRHINLYTKLFISYGNMLETSMTIFFMHSSISSFFPYLRSQGRFKISVYWVNSV